MTTLSHMYLDDCCLYIYRCMHDNFIFRCHRTRSVDKIGNLIFPAQKCRLKKNPYLAKLQCHPSSMKTQMECRCSSFGTYAVLKVVPVRVMIYEKWNYFMTSLQVKNYVQVKFENSMHNYNATLVH